VSDPRRLLWPALLILAALPPFFINDYVQYILNSMLVYAVVAVGFNIVLGYAGQLAFANAAFFGVGAYTTAICMSRWHWPFLLALLAAAVVTALVGFVVSLPALRLRAYYLAIVTLAFGELLRWGYIHADWLTQGSSGLLVPSASVFGISLASDRARYWLFLGLTALVLWGSANLLRSRFGRALVACGRTKPLPPPWASPRRWPRSAPSPGAAASSASAAQCSPCCLAASVRKASTCRSCCCISAW